jgi:hypothetical protein
MRKYIPKIYSGRPFPVITFQTTRTVKKSSSVVAVAAVAFYRSRCLEEMRTYINIG